jgi:general secretion pathway protein M
MEQITTWYKGLQQQERLLVNAGGILLGFALLYFALLAPLANAVTSRQTRVEQKQQDLTWMSNMSNTVRVLATSGANANTGESMVVLVNRSAQQDGVASAITQETPQGENSIRIRLEGANFDSVVTWLGTLEKQFGIKIDNASVDRADKVGIVNASLVLVRGGARP